MPRNRLSAFLIHGTMRLLGVLPFTRSLFEDLKIKPQNTFDSGLFRRARSEPGCAAAPPLPQGWVRRP